jgi:rRNA-processing protein FCF1
MPFGTLVGDMSRYVLDASVLFGHPEILGRISSRDEVLITAAAVRAVERVARSGPDTVANLLRDAIDRGVVRAVTDSDESMPSRAEPRFIWDLLEEESAIRVAQRYDAAVVTDDRLLQHRARRNDIPVLSAEQWLHERGSTARSDLSDQADATAQKLRWQRRRDLLFGLVGNVLLYLALHYFAEIVSTIRIWGTVLAVPLLALFFYWLRQNQRMAYAAIEVVFGVVAAIYILPSGFDYSTIGVNTIIQVAGFVYVIVRGLDNLGVALETTRFARIWHAIFPG